ncbi:hypothetical protein J437_LFUL015436 [Ladona fulva]|uniref:Uncharacterized protein n=1 Tax=Ladona fulva TaxID=123851 RepID=A0A8K0P6G1_LADFU|nr:hypothetical protein J437_LFUL015436 [Ladona fulva]
MIWLIVLALSAASLAAPQLPAQQQDVTPTIGVAAKAEGVPEAPVGAVAILNQTSEFAGDGSYKFSFDTEDGVHRDESGYLKTSVPPPEEGAPEDFDGTAQVQEGSFSYTGPDGVVYKLTYVADENGFRVQGDHLPTAPPVAGNSQGPAVKAVTVPAQVAENRPEEVTTIAPEPLPLQTELSIPN